MARDTSKLVTIPGELHSAATGNIVSATQEIFDYDSNSYQSQLNKQTYNVSAHGDTSVTYTLETAIAAVPETYHVGGLIITFINEFGEFNMYQLSKKDWSSNVNDWGCIYATAENPEYIDVHLDSSGHILYGVRRDGDFYFGAGVPSQVQSEIDSVRREIDDEVKTSIDKLESRVDSSFNEIDSSLNFYIEDSSIKFSNIDSSLNDLGFYQDNPEFARVAIDASNKILYGVHKDGNFYFGAGVPNQIKNYVSSENMKQDASINKIERRFLNLNDYDGSVGKNYTLEEAIAAVPEDYRHGGLILTFNSYGSNVIYQCKLDEFSFNSNDWKEFIDKEYVDSSLFDLKNNFNSSISSLNYKTSEILNEFTFNENEQIIITTDDNVEVTSISAGKCNDDEEKIIFTTNDNTHITSIEILNNNKDDSELLEFCNENNTQTYAKIGVVDDKSGIFVNNLYDLNGNQLLAFDLSNDILILAGKKYKMIPYIEEN